MYGTETCGTAEKNLKWFENDVKMYGTETFHGIRSNQRKFENDVKMYGTETYMIHDPVSVCLRMM